MTVFTRGPGAPEIIFRLPLDVYRTYHLGTHGHAS